MSTTKATKNSNHKEHQGHKGKPWIHFDGSQRWRRRASAVQEPPTLRTVDIKAFTVSRWPVEGPWPVVFVCLVCFVCLRACAEGVVVSSSRRAVVQSAKRTVGTIAV